MGWKPAVQKVSYTPQRVESVSPFHDYRIHFRTAELDRVPSHCDNSSAASGLSSPKNGDTHEPFIPHVTHRRA